MEQQTAHLSPSSSFTGIRLGHSPFLSAPCCNYYIQSLFFVPIDVRVLCNPLRYYSPSHWHHVNLFCLMAFEHVISVFSYSLSLFQQHPVHMPVVIRDSHQHLLQHIKFSIQHLSLFLVLWDQSSRHCYNIVQVFIAISSSGSHSSYLFPVIVSHL